MNHPTAYAYLRLNQITKEQDTFLGELVILADKMISSSDPEMYLDFPRISQLDISLYSRINRYMPESEYTAFLTNDEQLTLVLLILNSEGIDYEYHQ